ncbi:hypothetical protein HPP92_021683 [Vanilla planifolia]|uniref:Pentatricopeptide repeat-containing protein n=1 Tax=Vanilla planifolia TaxID=51239 RepID=A0A835PXM9_VANPL|nr:hypothetical protein HPP92_022001 [Vanilla planifolia]KAG0463207.1 hypothetical protein HPP92_021683 [Vanilla planifolia]
MVMRDLKPDYETSEVLLKGFILKGDIAFAMEALKRMLDNGHRPSTDTFHSILSLLLRKDGYANEAADVVQWMLDRKILQNVDLSTNVVGKLFGNGLIERAFDLVVKVYASGFRLNMEKLVDILCQEKKFLEARDILLFSLEKKEELDPPVFCRVIDELCSIEKASEAFDLFYKAIEEYTAGVFCSCMNSLKVALEQTGGLKEAEFVCKQISYVKFAKK